MIELTDRLRQNAASGDSCRGVSEDMVEAADEIERLNRALHLRTVQLGHSQEDIAAAAIHNNKPKDNRIAELEAIVAKLPVTADGVPVVPGDTAVRWCVHKGEIHEVTGWVWSELDDWRGHVDSVPQGDGYVLTRPVSLCYSTREAAEAARKTEEMPFPLIPKRLAP